MKKAKKFLASFLACAAVCAVSVTALAATPLETRTAETKSYLSAMNQKDGGLDEWGLIGLAASGVSGDSDTVKGIITTALTDISKNGFTGTAGSYGESAWGSNAGNLAKLKKLYQDYVFDILGLKAESESVSQDHEVLGKILDMVMSIRTEAKQKKDWATSDKIRDELKAAGVAIKDTKEGYEWELVEN